MNREADGTYSGSRGEQPPMDIEDIVRSMKKKEADAERKAEVAHWIPRPQPDSCDTL